MISMDPAGLWDLVKRLNAIGAAITGESNLDQLLELIVTEARYLANCDAGSLYTLENETLCFRIAQCETLARRPQDARPPFSDMSIPIGSDSIAGYVALTGEVLNLPDVYNLPPEAPYSFKKDLVDEPYGYRSTSMLTLPLRTPNRDIVGVLQLINPLDEEGRVVPFSPFMEELCSLLASQAAVALNNALMYSEWQRTHELYHGLVGDAGDAMIAFDQEGTVLSWNTGAERMFGWTAEKAKGRSWQELQGADAFNQIKKTIEQVFTSKKFMNVETRHYRKRGEWFDALLTASPVRDVEGRVTAALSVIKDITDRKRAEEELRAAHEELKRAYDSLAQAQATALNTEKLAAVGRLTAGVSHEILNPLNTIIIRLYMMIDDDETPPNMREDLKEMMEQARRITKISQDLLYFSRQSLPERTEVNIHEAVERTVALLEHELRLSNIVVERRFAEGLPNAWADRDQFQQLVLNLLTNAKDAMPEGGLMVLKTSQAPPLLKSEPMSLELRVEDSGPGIDPGIMDMIFDPFFTTKPEGKGTGMGLSICHGIIEAHCGKIWVENIPTGGAAFVVRMPIGPKEESTT